MIKKITLAIILLFNLIFNVNAEKINFFDEAKNLFENEKYEDSKFLFQRNIVYNPKDSKSYLYLAKIYNIKEDQKKEEKNLEATLLIEPDNEEAILMSMKIALEKSNYKKVKDLSKTFITRMNSLNENEYLQLGQQLSIGNKNIHRNMESKKRTILYSVKQGDNLFKISELFDVSVNSIEEINNFKEPTLMPGQIIKIAIRAF